MSARGPGILTKTLAYEEIKASKYGISSRIESIYFRPRSSERLQHSMTLEISSFQLPPLGVQHVAFLIAVIESAAAEYANEDLQA